jgi:5,10-methenyltetrahydrofolate synthetase
MNWPEVKAWRREAREKLLAARAAISVSVREDLSRRLIERLRPMLRDRPQPISFYWPIKAEPDLKPLMREFDAAGVRVCLPVAIKLGEPLSFRPWTRGTRMARGLWDIPIPADTAEVEPKTLIAPIVGFDAGGYRLGYGGGFFDRTLAKLGDSAAIGVGFSMFRLATIHPQPHDVRMAALVTEAGIVAGDAAAPASAVCYLNESDSTYAGFDTPVETVHKLAGLIGQLPPERSGLLDYVLWRLGGATETAPAAESLLVRLDQVLPRIRDDAIHAALAALRASVIEA